MNAAVMEQPHFEVAAPTISAEVVTITPLMAERMLQRSAPNRPVSHRSVDKIANEISEGRWRCNGEAIILSDHGEVLDGQHRLNAVKKAQRSIRSVVVRGVDASVMATIDDCRTRTAADVLAIHGTSSQTLVAAILRGLKHFEATGTFYNLNNTRISNAESLDVLRRWPNAKHWARLVLLEKRFIPSGSVVAAICTAYESLGYPTEKIERFISDVQVGAGLAPDSPALALRNKFVEIRSTRGAVIRPDVIAAYTIQALGDYLRDKPRRIVRWAENQSFPTL